MRVAGERLCRQEIEATWPGEAAVKVGRSFWNQEWFGRELEALLQCPDYVEENKESDDPDLFGVSVAIYFRGKSRWGRQELEAEFLRD